MEDRVVAITDTRVLTVERPCLRITMSPERLNLQLFCIPGRSARKSLDFWPPLPLIIFGGVSDQSVNNIMPVLGRGLEHRICQINLEFYSWKTEKIYAAMQVPFRELAGLYLGGSSYMRHLPDSFLGGSAPRLRHICLRAIPSPGLPKLLLSAIQLVDLHPHDIPYSGHISAKAMFTCLSVLNSNPYISFYDKEN